MKILWITSRLLPDACRKMGWREDVVGGWMQAQLTALLRTYGDAHEYLILASDSRKCDVQLGNVRHRSFGYGKATYGNQVPTKVEEEAKSIIAGFKPDIIHIHGTEFFYGRMRKMTYCDAPTIVSLQGIINGLYMHVNGELSQDELYWYQFNLRRVLMGSSVFREQQHWRKKRIIQERLVFEMHNHFMGRTDWDRAWTRALSTAARYYHVNETLRDVFYGDIRWNRMNIRPHSIYCSAATGYPLKGVHILFKAVACLKDKYPDISVRVCAAEKLVRKSSLVSFLKAEQYNSYLRHLIRKMGVERHVVGLPRLSALDVADELLKAELFVLPSFCENSPNSLGEAQLIGTPSIATFVGGIPSILRDGLDGRFVPSGDPATLAEMIDWYFSNPEKVDAYANSARMVAQVRHDPTRNAKATIAAYEKVIADAI